MTRAVFRISAVVSSIIIVFIVFANVWIIGSTRNKVHNSLDEKSALTTILLLGTSSKTVKGEENPFFYERIKTASTLYQTGRISEIVLSGDHVTKYYDEPKAMQMALVALGVPDSILRIDGGGVRTLDSVIRCKKVLNIDSVIIVTQRFHAYRALFISRYFDLNAIVVITDPVESPRLMGVLVREALARPLAVIDLYFLNRQPDMENIILN